MICDVWFISFSWSPNLRICIIDDHVTCSYSLPRQTIVTVTFLVFNKYDRSLSGVSPEDPRHVKTLEKNRLALYNSARPIDLQRSIINVLNVTLSSGCGLCGYINACRLWHSQFSAIQSVHLAITLLEDEESPRDNHVLACKCPTINFFALTDTGNKRF